MGNSMTLKGRESLEVKGDALVRVPDGTEGVIIVRPSGEAKVEVRVGKGCRLKIYTLQEAGASIHHVNRVGEGSRVDTFSVWLSGGSGSMLNSLEGPRAEAYDVQVFVEGGEEKLRLDSVLRHASGGTKGNILVKGVVKDAASARLDGMIKIEKDGGGAESFLSEHVILLNPGAHASANPELEIENNDVSSRHAASVSQIEEEKIFYLCSRGLSRVDARKMIVEGFLEAAMDRIPDEGMRKKMMEKAMAAV